jgi:peroxiredoxin Q/BCP
VDVTTCLGAQELSMLKPGDDAPTFEVPDQDGETVRLADLRGGRVLLWFYPAADTPG